MVEMARVIPGMIQWPNGQWEQVLHQMTNGNRPSIRSELIFGVSIPLDPAPSSLRAVPSRLWGPSQCFLLWLTSSNYLLDPECLSALS